MGKNPATPASSARFRGRRGNPAPGADAEISRRRRNCSKRPGPGEAGEAPEKKKYPDKRNFCKILRQKNSGFHSPKRMSSSGSIGWPISLR